MILTRSFLSQVVMASKASRLLKSVRLMLAREKSYDVSQAEEGKRGRKAGRTAYQHRFVQKQTRPTHIYRFIQIKARLKPSLLTHVRTRSSLLTNAVNASEPCWLTRPISGHISPVNSFNRLTTTTACKAQQQQFIPRLG